MVSEPKANRTTPPLLRRNVLSHTKAKIVSLLFLCTLMACGCATTTERPLAGNRLLQIEGSSYLPLAAIAARHALRMEWDAKAQRVDLEKEGLHLRLRIGSTVVVANGETEMLDRPVLLHTNTVVVPASFSKSLSHYLPAEEILPEHPVRIQRAIVDAGHGGDDMGAVGKMGLKEKQINLDIARRLTNELEAQGLSVTMTRKDDYFISLYQRTYIANREEGDFFVSVHCNASRNRDVDGFEVYYATPLEGPSEEVTVAEASPADSFYESSMELAGHITSAMETHLSSPNRGVKSARFFVLKGVHMPAVLVEVGYISNAEEETLLEEKSYRQNVAEAIAEGVLAYKHEFEKRPPYRDF